MVDEDWGPYKWCTRCGSLKHLDEFWKQTRAKDGHTAMCIPCQKEYTNSLRKNRSPEQRTAYNRQWRKDNPDKVKAWRPGRRAYAKNQYRQRITDLLQAYGNKCACCQEDNSMFLTFDHVDGIPDDHRTKSGARIAGTAVVNKLWHYLQEHGKPDSRCQILGFNCNCGRERNNGICPHKEVML